MPTPVGARMEWQRRNEQGIPQPAPTLPQLDPNDPMGASGDATGGPNAIGRIRGSTFKDFTPVQQQQQLATQFMQSRGIPLNAQNREQVMQFLMGTDPAAAAAPAPVDTAGQISAGIDAADAGADVPGPAPAGPAPLARPGAPPDQQGTDFNPLWLLFPAIGKKMQGGLTTESDYAAAKAGDSIVPLARSGEILDPNTPVRPAVDGDNVEAYIDGTWTVVDDPDDAAVQQAIASNYGQDAGAPPAVDEIAPGQPAQPTVFQGDSPEMAGGLNVFTGEDDTNVFRDTPPNAPAGDFDVFADPASAPIATEEVVPEKAAAPTAKVGGKTSEERTQESKARREAAKEKRAKSGAGKAAKAVRGAKK